MNKQIVQGKSIQLAGIRKSWDGVVAVDNIDIEVAAGSFTVLLGPSGCGKSTTLRIIAGLENADQGEVIIGGQDVSQRPPAQRDIAMVFQSYALFPHLSVAENILFGLKVRRIGRAEQKQRLEKTAEMLGLTPYLQRKPSQLSGGQQQRVALGRAIIAEKPICLMDEPLSNLDAKLRNAMRSEIRELQQALGFSMVYVTHDQAEAITMADQVVLLNAGRVEQAAAPRDIYEQPANTFVANFIGTPPMNLLPAELVIGQLNGENTAFTIGVRPEHVRLAANETNGLAAHVTAVEYLGSDTLLDCQVGENTSITARLPGSVILDKGDTVKLVWEQSQTYVFNAKSGERMMDDRLPMNGLFQV